MPATHGMEEYLEAIYVLEGEGESVIGARLADHLGVKPPTVTQTLRRLERDGYVMMNDDKVVHLTGHGHELAEAIVRKHRLVERWLTDVLGLDWAQAHEEACRLEHAMSPLVEERLADLLGHPTTCPHGNPIPGTSAMSRPAGQPLDRLPAGAVGRILRISEQMEDVPDLLAYLESNGLVPGTRLTVEETGPYNRTVTVRLDGRSDGRTVSVDPDIAAKIWVEVVR